MSVSDSVFAIAMPSGLCFVSAEGARALDLSQVNRGLISILIRCMERLHGDRETRRKKFQ